jgi:hypothetical protein
LHFCPLSGIIIVSRQEKLFKRFLKRPKDFSYDELATLLAGFGYKAAGTGKTAGSRVAFINENTKHIIRLHKPHPRTVMKMYQMAEVERELRAKGLIP